MLAMLEAELHMLDTGQEKTGKRRKQQKPLTLSVKGSIHEFAVGLFPNFLLDSSTFLTA